MADDVAYWHCPVCDLRFMDAASLPEAKAEKAHYDRHNNDLDDPNYRRFLNRLAEPLLAELSTRQGALDVLDFGAGPGPLLARMLTEAGCRTAIYDPFYAPDQDVLRRRYDVITATEVAEHFHRPRAMFDQLHQLLNPGAVLAIMTGVVTEDVDFARWHYRRDPTHVAFYSRATLAFIAGLYGYGMAMPHPNVVIFRAD
ncbi:MAG: class I SAM-dependent methyltransferase [Alphaproteobacteria bacterium]|nr:class I SAM-dependent methyltransferase [Alphaproteobacteria bacterium]